MLNLLWKFLYAIGHLFIATNGQIWKKNNTAIWSHCPPPLTPSKRVSQIIGKINKILSFNFRHFDTKEKIAVAWHQSTFVRTSLFKCFNEGIS